MEGCANPHISAWSGAMPLHQWIWFDGCHQLQILWHLPKYFHVRQVNPISYGSSWVGRTLYTTTPLCQSAPLVWRWKSIWNAILIVCYFKISVMLHVKATCVQSLKSRVTHFSFSVIYKKKITRIYKLFFKAYEWSVLQFPLIRVQNTPSVWHSVLAFCSVTKPRQPVIC